MRSSREAQLRATLAVPPATRYPHLRRVDDRQRRTSKSVRLSIAHRDSLGLPGRLRTDDLDPKPPGAERGRVQDVLESQPRVVGSGVLVESAGEKRRVLEETLPREEGLSRKAPVTLGAAQGQEVVNRQAESQEDRREAAPAVGRKEKLGRPDQVRRERR